MTRPDLGPSEWYEPGDGLTLTADGLKEAKRAGYIIEDNGDGAIARRPRGRPPKATGTARSLHVTARLTAPERAALDRGCELRGVSPSRGIGLAVVHWSAALEAAEGRRKRRG